MGSCENLLNNICSVIATAWLRSGIYNLQKLSSNKVTVAPMTSTQLPILQLTCTIVKISRRSLVERIVPPNEAQSVGPLDLAPWNLQGCRFYLSWLMVWSVTEHRTSPTAGVFRFKPRPISFPPWFTIIAIIFWASQRDKTPYCVDLVYSNALTAISVTANYYSTGRQCTVPEYRNTGSYT